MSFMPPEVFNVMYAIDTNLLVYAHNKDAAYHKRAEAFIEQVMNERDAQSRFQVCIPAQVLVEFLNVITWSKLEAPLSLAQAIRIAQTYIDSGVPIIHAQPTQLSTCLALLAGVTTRKKVFDVVLVATLKDVGVKGLYTVNTKDFVEFDFLNVVNPLA